MDIERIISLLNNYDGVVTIEKEDFKMPLFTVRFEKSYLSDNEILVKQGDFNVTYLRLKDIKTVTMDGRIILN